MRAAGISRVLIANELVDPASIRWAAADLADGNELICQVDSTVGVAALDEAPGRGAARFRSSSSWVTRPVGRGAAISEARWRSRRTSRGPTGFASAGVTAYEGRSPTIAGRRASRTSGPSSTSSTGRGGAVRVS